MLNTTDEILLQDRGSEQTDAERGARRPVTGAAKGSQRVECDAIDLVTLTRSRRASRSAALLPRSRIIDAAARLPTAVEAKSWFGSACACDGGVILVRTRL